MFSRQTLTWLAVLLGILGVIFLIGGIVYITSPAESLPSFFPGHTPHLTGHRGRRGTALIILAAVVWICAAASVIVARRRSYWHRSVH